MLDESYTLEYTTHTLEEMSEAKRAIFEGPLKRLVISQVMVFDILTIRFYLYKDHFLEAVTKWPWLLCSNLGEHLEKCYDDETKISYDNVVMQAYRKMGYVKKP
jgi:hypothetical protein